MELCTNFCSHLWHDLKGIFLKFYKNYEIELAVTVKNKCSVHIYRRPCTAQS